MPHILVPHTHRIITLNNSSDGKFFPSLKSNVRRIAAQELSIKKRPLKEEDFSFFFLLAGPYDEPLHDLDLLILAHADEERLANDPDNIAENISAMVAVTIEAAQSYVEEEINFSVAPFFGYMGYHASSASPRHKRITV